ncbi:elongin-C [Nematocida sp. LUAm3]|nr:elongin-C [Nematocida sp. LUAm3]KAI5175523.1 elongin-C [Nematocida sp. LUAm2]KAI5178447.1 elongin-C [Nematocida sp. LUAm1]
MKRTTEDISLISSEGAEIKAPYYIICESQVLQSLVDSPFFVECNTSTVSVPIRHSVLKKVVEYLWYKHKYSIKQGHVEDFIISEEETLDLLDVSNFLRI